MKRDCWELENNKDFCPKGWKSSKSGEVGNTAMDKDELSLFFNEDQEIGREVGILCMETNEGKQKRSGSKGDDEDGYEMKDVLSELADIEKIANRKDMNEAFWHVPVPKPCNWYIDTDNEEADGDEPPRVIMRRKIILKNKSKDDNVAKMPEDNDEKEGENEIKNHWGVYESIEEYERNKMRKEIEEEKLDDDIEMMVVKSDDEI